MDSSTTTFPVITSRRMPTAVANVYQAIVDPAKLSGFFISAADAPMTPGADITWTFDDVGVNVAVHVEAVEAERRVVYRWGAAAGGPTSTVDIELRPDGTDATVVTVTEHAFEFTPDGVQRALEQMQGWTDFLCSMNAYLLYGVNLRNGAIGARTP